MGTIIKKNYESDFSVLIKLPPIVGEHDFRLEFYTLRSGKYIAKREQGILTTNISNIGDDKYLVMLRNHQLKEGRLRVKAYCELTNIDSPDKIMLEVVPIYTEIELWGGQSDEIENIDIEILPQIVNITRVRKIGNLRLTTCEIESESEYGYDISQFELVSSVDDSYYYYYSGEDVGVFDELNEISNEQTEGKAEEGESLCD